MRVAQGHAREQHGNNDALLLQCLPFRVHVRACDLLKCERVVIQQLTRFAKQTLNEVNKTDRIVREA